MTNASPPLHTFYQSSLDIFIYLERLSSGRTSVLLAALKLELFIPT